MTVRMQYGPKLHTVLDPLDLNPNDATVQCTYTVAIPFITKNRFNLPSLYNKILPRPL